jgi:hypothetical protein
VYIADGNTLHPSSTRGISLFNISSSSSNTGAAAASSDDMQKAHLARETVHRLIARYAGMAREAGVCY